MTTTRTKIDQEFVSRAEVFLAAVRAAFGVTDSYRHVDADAQPLHPVVINDYSSLSTGEVQAMARSYWSRDGVCAFVVMNRPTEKQASHPIFELASQLASELPLKYALAHPLETHPETIRRFGGDGTVKVYDVRKLGPGYKEQGETSDEFAMHCDGLGSGGTVEAVALYMESAPLWGGFTYFQNIALLAADLAEVDWDAYSALFLPDAISIVRPRGKGAIRVTGPVLYLNEDRRPQVFFRRESGEYRVIWRNDPDLERAQRFLARYTQAFAPGSTFVQFARAGQGCLVRNSVLGHARTAFLNGRTVETERVLSRKWFMRSERDVTYKHVPGLFVEPALAPLRPDIFGPDVLHGEWILNDVGVNQRML